MKKTLLKHLSSQKPTLSLEAKVEEYEIEIYLKGYDLEQIKRLAVSHEHQEQWTVFVPRTDANAAEGTLRIRKTTKVDETTYVFAIKSARADGSKDEDEYDVEESAFEMMKALAPEGMVKMRYNVPHQPAGRDPMVFEADVFYDKTNSPVPWLKIDMETKPGTRLTEEDIPFTYDEIIIAHPADKKSDPALSKRLKSLYIENFVCKNMLT